MTGTEPGGALGVDERAPRRVSRQRATVHDFLDGLSTFASAQQIHAGLAAAGHRVGLATVYRALQAMVEDGEVDVLRGEDGETAYRRCGLTGHHHHLLCRTCGFAVEVRDEPVARWAERTAAAHGFSDVEHRVEVFGRCASCRAPDEPATTPSAR